MKIDRLLGIVTLLAKNNKLKAKELAQRYEVSVRTIHRDIEDICKAGIPIVTYPGGDGGIGIAEGFKLDKNILTKKELESIILGLKSLDSVMAGTHIAGLLQKLSPHSENLITVKDDIIIDLTSFYRDSLSKKINLLQEAIAEKSVVEFEYYAKNSTAKREIEPYFIAFKWSAWYVFGYCRLRDDFRLFKLNRLTQLKQTDKIYEMREVTDKQLNIEWFYRDPEKKRYATLILERSLEYVLVDQYGADSYEILEGGKLRFEWDYVDENVMVKQILSLGSGAKAEAPESLVNALKEESGKIYSMYK